MNLKPNFTPLQELPETETKTQILRAEIDNEVNAGRFPIEIFTPEIQAIFKETESKINFSFEYLAAGLLTAAGAAIGNTFKLNFKFDGIGVFYCCIVGESGTNKTAPLNFAIKPLQNRDSENHKAYQELKAAYDENQKLPVEQRAELVAPTYRQTVIGDTTTEGLFHILKDNPGGAVIHADELAGYFNTHNRYSKGNDQQIMLQFFNGLHSTVNRKGSEPVRIENPRVSIVGGIQPGILPNIFKDDRTSDGTLDRFLFFDPNEVPEIKWTKERANPAILAHWDEIINNILSLESEETHSLTLTPAAEDFLIDWQNNLPKDISPVMRSADAKLQTYTVRFCLLLHVLNHAASGKIPLEIETETVKHAVKLYGYFRETAVKVRRRIGLIEGLEDLDEAQQKVFRALPTGEEIPFAAIKDLARKHELTEDAVKKFVKKEQFFRRTGHGKYKKIAQS